MLSCHVTTSFKFSDDVSFRLSFRMPFRSSVDMPFMLSLRYVYHDNRRSDERARHARAHDSRVISPRHSRGCESSRSDYSLVHE